MQTVNNPKAPTATAKVSALINRLATIRLQAAALAKVSKKIADTIAPHGTCRNERYVAYVTHCRAQVIHSVRKASTKVVLKKIK